MEELTKSDKIKIKILRILSDFNVHTPSELSIILETNQNTILSNCLFMKILGLVDIEIKTTKRVNYFINLRKEFLFNNVDELIKNIKDLKLYK